MAKTIDGVAFLLIITNRMAFSSEVPSGPLIVFGALFSALNPVRLGLGLGLGLKGLQSFASPFEALPMASLTFAQFLSLSRWCSNYCYFPPSGNLVQLQDLRLQKRWGLVAMSKKNNVDSMLQEAVNEEAVVENKKSRNSKRSPTQAKKKAGSKILDENSISAANGDVMEEETTTAASSEGSKKTQRRSQVKAKSAPSSSEEEKIDRKVTRRRRTKKKVADKVDEGSDAELSDREGDAFLANVEDDNEEDVELGKDGEDDISFTYGWPPLVCCFGAAQHAYLPSARPANRLIDYEMHERMKDAIWSPEKFVRAPGGSASTVAVALASLGGRVAFMGKLADDDYGQSLLYYLNVNNVQTRSVHINSKRVTAASLMKIGKRSGLRMTCIKPCAEDSLSKSEINLDVLKEAKMFYFSTSSLLDRHMRSTALQAIKISKKLGGVIFYDLNLPLPLWQSCEETKLFIQQVWNLADVIEVTKQELEFLCGIEPSENFDTKDNDRSKFVHYKPAVFHHLWHENLKVLFVTNGTSKIHYYTKEHDGAVLGMEDAPITPFTGDMSASGDGIVAALLKMLTDQPHLITNKAYLEHTIKYAINCGVIEQWLLARTHGFPPKESMGEGVIPDPNGIKSITDREYRTLEPVS